MSASKKELDDLFNTQLYLYFHDDILDENRTVGECLFMIQKLGITAGAEVLDLACGHGRHANYLAGQGFGLTGWDINSDFIKMAVKDAGEKELAIDYHCKDILDINYENRFAAILLLFNTLGFFSRENAQLLMHSMSKSLLPKGRIFLDIKNRDHVVQELMPCSIVEKGADMMIDRLSFDPKTGTTSNQRTYIKDGQRYEAPFVMTLYNYTDMERMTLQAGLSIREVYGHWDGRAFDQDSKRMILIVEKG